MNETRPLYKRKFDALHRYRIWHFSKRVKENIFVTEFPRSGGTWLSQMLSEITGLPFPRNQNVTTQPCILHGHHLIKSEKKKIIHVLRDGRDVMVSAYCYFLLNEDLPESNVIRWRNRMPFNDYQNIRKNLASFIEVFFESYRAGFVKLKWNHFIIEYYNTPTVLNVKYEDLNTNTLETMINVVEWLKSSKEQNDVEKIIDKYSFANQTGRIQGEENPNVFMRKGVVGDWKNYFTKESATAFNLHASEALIQAGYEKNEKWYE